jgi:hypothetical protein
MRPSEKLKEDILKSARSLSPDRCIDQNFAFLPEEPRALLRELFQQRFAADPDAAAEWLGTLGTIFFQDYDETPLTLDDWHAVRDIVSLGADVMDMDLVSYVMNLVMEHKAL